MSHHALLVVGSGPGIGRNTAALFAEKGFQHVILLSRNAERLKEDADFVKKAAATDVRVDTVTVDLVDLSSVRKSLDEVSKLLDNSKVPLEAVLHNAARVGESKFTEFPVEEFEKDLAIAVTSMYVIASWAMPRLLEVASKAQPAFLVTSGLLWKEPFSHLFSLSACKAAQYNMINSMFQQYRPKGVHCGLVVVGGVVKDDAKVTSARNVANEFWKLYSQSLSSEWQLDVTMLDPEYKELLEQRKADSAK